jgi:hypothetical protein
MDLRSFPVSARWGKALLIPAALVAPALCAQDNGDEAYQGENPDRYASIRILEGEATIRKGDVEEALSRGVPVTEGDVVESHGRGVLQLADGTRVAFGPETRFQVAALFQEKDPEHRVLLRLDRGRLRLALGRESDARLRVDTPSGAGSLSDGSNADFEVEGDRTVRMKVFSGRVVFNNERDQASILAGERLTVYSGQDRLDRVREFSTYGGDAFDSWSDRALEVHHGPSWERMPSEIRSYSDDLDESGEWVYVDEFHSWCWRPIRVEPEWRPYWRGRWGAYPGGMTWISDEPWGFVTYHYGRWGWGASLGWYWIPGVYYAPAWVAWETSDAYFGWAPMGYYGRPVAWGYGPWGGGYCWNVVEISFIHERHLHEHMDRRPEVIHRFDPGPGGHGNRPLTAPWQQGPLVVNQTEFRNPAQMQRVLQDPHTMRTRVRTYEQQAGRTLYRRPLTGAGMPPVSAPPPITEDRGRPHEQTEHPIFRNEPPPATRSPALSRPLTRPLEAAPPPVQEVPRHRRIPLEQPGAANPSPLPPPPQGHPGVGHPTPPVQPRETPHMEGNPAPGGSPAPLPWRKKKRPLQQP